jgi:hypothetical protein
LSVALSPPPVRRTPPGIPAFAGRIDDLPASLAERRTLPGKVSVSIWMLPPLKTWMASPIFVPRGMAFRVVFGHQHHATVANPDVVVAVNIQAPRHADWLAAWRAS